MRVLDRKLTRDLRRLWAQALAIALVIAGGVAALLMAVGSYRSLEETRSAYYERHRFADVFANARRAPKSLVASIAEIPGVAAVEARITKLALLDLPNIREPASAHFISLPEAREPVLNRLYMRLGRLPSPDRMDEVVVNEGFAKAHSFEPGSRFAAILNGRKRTLLVVGIALSPEFVYAIGPGDIMPDDRRFGVVWMSERALASIYDLEDVFSSVSVKLLADASRREVVNRLDAMLDRYDGSAAYERRDQTSHAFLDHSLDMLGNMSRTLPPVFLLVGAFLINLTLGRLVTLEREQVGLLKAVGYGNSAIIAHYLKFVLAIALSGVAIGSAVGTWLGGHLTSLLAGYYSFPFLVFIKTSDLYVAAAALSILAAVGGAARPLGGIVRLSPAVAMQPPSPARFRRLFLSRYGLRSVLPQPVMMMLRTMMHHPARSALTTLGMALATGILIVSLFINGAMEQLIRVTYFLTDRQDATVSFGQTLSRKAAFEIARVPGVLAVETSRDVPVRIRYGHIERRTRLSGRSPEADLSRIVDVDLRPLKLPETGVAISEWLAKTLNVGVGDVVELDLLEGARRTVFVPVTAQIEDIGDPGDLEVIVDLLSMEAVRVEIGAGVRIEEWGGPSLQGRVTRIDPAAFTKLSSLGFEEQRVRTLIEIMDPPESWSRLGHNFRVIVHITVWRGENVLMLPVSALFRRGDDWAAFAVRNGRAQSNLVEIGRRNGRFAEVLSGLVDGDQVVLHPSDRIRDGARISTRESR